MVTIKRDTCQGQRDIGERPVFTQLLFLNTQTKLSSMQLKPVLPHVQKGLKMESYPHIQ